MALGRNNSVQLFLKLGKNIIPFSKWFGDRNIQSLDNLAIEDGMIQALVTLTGLLVLITLAVLIAFAG